MENCHYSGQFATPLIFHSGFFYIEIDFSNFLYPNQINDEQLTKNAKSHAETSMSQGKENHVNETSQTGTRSLAPSFLAVTAK